MLAFLAAGCLLVQSEGWPELLRQLDDDDPARRDAASRAIRRMGPRILPDLERAMGDASPEVRCRLSEIRHRFPEVRLRSILQSPAYPAVRRRWNAVIEAIVWKRPLPAEVWREIASEKSDLRELQDPRPHTPPEILAELRESARQVLWKLALEVGVEGDPELSHGGMRPVIQIHDFLPMVLEAEPDPVSFEEVYGTLVTLQFEAMLPSWSEWVPEDLQTAIRILVQVRRRKDLEPVLPNLSRDEALKLACRGPLVQGMADAVGRSIANRRRAGRYAQQDLEPWPKESERPSALREVYDLLLQLNVEIGHRYCSMDLLRPARREVPEKVSPVAERSRRLFDLARSPESGDAVERVIGDLLANCHFTEWEQEQLGTVAVLLRAIGTRVAEESR